MTCIILAGGAGVRMGGVDKAFLSLKGEDFVERKIRQLGPLFDEVLVVVRETGPYLDLPARIAADRVPGQGPLMGLYTGLLESSSDINFVTTVDSPFVSLPLVSMLLEGIGDYDAHVPRRGAYTEPLFAVYRKSCIPHIEKNLSRRRVISFYPSIDVKYAEEEQIRLHDPEYRSFININSKEEYRSISAC